MEARTRNYKARELMKRFSLIIKVLEDCGP